MIIVGDKLMVVKEIHPLHIGDIVTVTSISNGVISFVKKGCNGCMSGIEYDKYFERIEKRPWSEWRLMNNQFYDPFNNKHVIDVWMSVRDNGKKVQIKSNGYKAEASCCEWDKFDFETGYDIAFRRLVAKMMGDIVESYIRGI